MSGGSFLKLCTLISNDIHFRGKLGVIFSIDQSTMSFPKLEILKIAVVCLDVYLTILHRD